MVSHSFIFVVTQLQELNSDNLLKQTERLVDTVDIELHCHIM